MLCMWKVPVQTLASQVEVAGKFFTLTPGETLSDQTDRSDMDIPIAWHSTQLFKTYITYTIAPESINRQSCIASEYKQSNFLY